MAPHSRILPRWTAGPRTQPSDERDGGEHGGIVGAAGEHDIGPRFERPDEGLVPHLADDPRRAIDGGLSEGGHAAAALDPPVVQALLHAVLVDLGVDHGQLEVNIELARDLQDHLQVAPQMRLAPRPAGRADQQWYLLGARRLQQQAEITLHCAAVGEAVPGPEVVGARIGRSRVDGDRVGMA